MDILKNRTAVISLEDLNEALGRKRCFGRHLKGIFYFYALGLNSSTACIVLVQLNRSLNNFIFSKAQIKVPAILIKKKNQIDLCFY